MYQHQIGLLSRGAVLDVGLKCTHTCKFCYYSYLDQSNDQFRGMRRAAFRSVEDCKEILTRLKAQGFLNFDYTGGEPTLHPSIVEITRYAHQDLGLKGRMITLGQFLMKRMPHCRSERLIDDLIEAGLTNFLLSVHAVEETLFDRITGESWPALRAAMEYLDAKDFQYCSNTTVFAWNYQHLPAIARELLRHRVYLHNFIIMNAYYEWNRDGKAFGIQARYSEIVPYLREAIAILEEGGVAANIRYAPMCAVRGLEQHLVGMVGVRYDPHEWMNQAGHFGGSPEACAARIPVGEGQIEGYLTERAFQTAHENGATVIAMRGQHVKHFAAACAGCAARPVCDGIDPNYLKQYGDSEFQAYDGAPWNGPVHEQRRHYPAPFLIKTDQHEDMQSAVREALRPPIEQVAQPLIMPTKSPRNGSRFRVSVIVTCYNYARYLAESTDSVLAQTYQDFELIIVNDGSTDQSLAVAEQVKTAHPHHRVRIIDQPNSGQPALSRNRGIQEAQGEFILCLDADDKIAPTMLEACVTLLDSDQSISIAYTDRRDFDGVEQVVLAGEYDFPRLRYANHLSYCALYRKTAWAAVGGYRDNVRGCEDWDFWVAAGAKGHYGRRIPQPLFWYRRHDTGIYQDVIKQFDRLRAQIILNNRGAYEPEAISTADAFLKPVHTNTCKQSTPLVSVILPTFNRPERLQRAVASVLAQTHAQLEIIVVNDGGVEAEQALSQWKDDGRVIYVRLGRNRERSAARNAGLHLAQGAYIAYLDDDDWFEPHHVETLVAALERSGQKVAYADAKRIHEIKQGAEYIGTKADVPYSYPFDRKTLLVSNYIPMLCLVHRRSCLDEVGFFDESLSTHEDWELMIRLSRRFEFVHVPTVTCAFTWREDGSTTTSARPAHFIETASVIHHRYAKESAPHPDVVRAQGQFIQQLRAQRRNLACSIIVPVWNKAELTRQCLVKLAEVTQGVEYEVIMVDNGSTDETASFLTNLGGDVQIITNAENLGFARACNQGAQAAQGRYLVFLNNDTVPLDGWLTAMVEEVESHANVAVVGSKLLYENGAIQHSGVAFSWHAFTPYHIYRGVSGDSPLVNRRREFQAVTGACMLVRKDLFEAVGGFDERFRNGFEDVDLCLKIRARGGRIVYQPKSALYHLESRTSGRHAHDLENGKRLLEAWGHQWWLPDEYVIYAEDGHALRHTRAGGGWRDCLTPFADQEERMQWELVGQAQRLASSRAESDIDALKHCLERCAEWPADPIALQLGATISQHLHLASVAERFWTRVLLIDDFPDARVSLIRLALEQGRQEEAGRHVAMVLGQDPEHAEGWFLKGVAEIQGSAYEEAVHAFTNARAYGADPKKVLLGIGMAAIGQGHADRAWVHFLEALDLQPDDAEVLHWLIRAGTALERWDGLFEQVQRFAMRNPADLAVRLALAGVSLRLGKTDIAHREYYTIRMLDPAHDGLPELAKALEDHDACVTPHAG